MIISIGLSLLFILSLWGYLSLIRVFVFNGNLNLPEPRMNDRPNRRTIGRRNDDMTACVLKIVLSYAIIVGGFYILPRFLPENLEFFDIILRLALVALGMFILAPASRVMHAYIDLGHIVVVHFVSCMAITILIAGLIYNYELLIDDVVAYTLMVVGAMACFSRNNTYNRKDTVKDEGSSYDEEEDFL